MVLWILVSVQLMFSVYFEKSAPLRIKRFTELREESRSYCLCLSLCRSPSRRTPSSSCSPGCHLVPHGSRLPARPGCSPSRWRRTAWTRAGFLRSHTSARSGNKTDRWRFCVFLTMLMWVANATSAALARVVTFPFADMDSGFCIDEFRDSSLTTATETKDQPVFKL